MLIKRNEITVSKIPKAVYGGILWETRYYSEDGSRLNSASYNTKREAVKVARMIKIAQKHIKRVRILK